MEPWCSAPCMFAFFDLRGIRPALLILNMQGNINVQQSNMISCFEKKKRHKVFATFGGHVDSLRRCCWCFLYVFLSVHWTPWVFWKCCVENLWPYSRNLGFWKNTTYNAKRKWHQNCNLEVRNANNMDIKFATLRSDMQKDGYEKIWKPSWI